MPKDAACTERPLPEPGTPEWDAAAWKCFSYSFTHDHGPSDSFEFGMFDDTEHIVATRTLTILQAVELATLLLKQVSRSLGIPSAFPEEEPGVVHLLEDI